MDVDITKIKICGLSRPEDIETVNLFMPDYIGFVFAKSKRQVNELEAQKLKEELNTRIKAVGVFVDDDIERIVNLYRRGIIDLIQLHGDEGEDYIRKLKVQVAAPIIKAIPARSNCDIRNAEKLKVDYLLLDTYSKRQRGGTGKTFDWNMISSISRPFYIAGGINVNNVLQAIRQVKPYAIDVSSGVETNGYKDKEKIRQLISMVRNQIN